MDLRLFAHIVWRFRFVVVAGVLLTLVVALLSFLRLEIDGARPTFSYRQKQVWESEGLLFVTQSGFPWGRAVIEPEEEVAGEEVASQPRPRRRAAKPEEPRYADSARFGTLAILYAQLATSDPVRQLLLRDGPIEGEIDAAPVLATETLDETLRTQLRYESTLPLLRVSARADSPTAATALATREIDAFLRYLDGQQDASAIPGSERVAVTVLERPTETTLVEGRSKLYPALVLVSGFAMTLALVVLLEALWPRRRERDDYLPDLARSSGSGG